MIICHGPFYASLVCDREIMTSSATCSCSICLGSEICPYVKFSAEMMTFLWVVCRERETYLCLAVISRESESGTGPRCVCDDGDADDGVDAIAHDCHLACAKISCCCGSSVFPAPEQLPPFSPGSNILSSDLPRRGSASALRAPSPLSAWAVHDPPHRCHHCAVWNCDAFAPCARRRSRHLFWIPLRLVPSSRPRYPLPRPRASYI